VRRVGPRGVSTSLIAEILRLSRRMRRDAGRGPSAAELAGYLHLPLAEVRAALGQAKDLAAAAPAAAGTDRGATVPGGLAEALTAEEEELLLRRRLGASLDEDVPRDDARPPIAGTGARRPAIEAPEGS
jgi:hypothetical protein